MTTGYILIDTPNHGQPQGLLPRRGGAALSGTAIVHTSEGNWRSGVDGLTNLVRTRGDWGCYHQACDWADIARYYPWEWETWQDTETNNWAVGIAAACKTTDWGTMPADIEEGYYRNLARMAADFVAYMRDVHRITVPLKRITGAEARARKPGFAAHGDSGVARSDPGANFDWARFFNYTRQALGGITPQGTTVTPIKTKPKEWDEMASKEDIADVFAETLTKWMQSANGKKIIRNAIGQTADAAMVREVLTTVQDIAKKSGTSVGAVDADAVVDAIAARLGTQEQA